MTALMTVAGPSEYVSSGFARPAAIVQPSCGPSPLGSDPHEAFVASISAVLDRVEGDLLAWFRDPEKFADDETDAPSRDAIRAAMKFVQWLRADLSRLLLPLRAVTIGSGGSISLEFSRGSTAVTISFETDGSVEWLTFADGRLRSRQDLNLLRI